MARAKEHISGARLSGKAGGRQSCMVLFSEQIYRDQEQELTWMVHHSLPQIFPKDLPWA